MYKQLLDKIIEFDKITIFRHQRPDGDAVFSALSVYQFIKDNFKDKTIKVAGNDDFDLINKKDKISDKFIKESLAIVVDTSKADRVDDDRFATAKYIVKIDHHINVDDFADLNIVKDHAASCTEVLSDIFFSNTFKKYELSAKTCEYLYCGLMLDSIKLTTSNTSYHSIEVAAKLVKKGNLDVSGLINYLFDINSNEFNKATKLRSYFKIEGKFGYIMLSEKDLKKLDMTPNEAKNFINEIGNIKDINIWALLVEDNGVYNASLRSKKQYPINKIAEKYHGGGHASACGVKNLTNSSIKTLFSELIEISTK